MVEQTRTTKSTERGERRRERPPVPRWIWALGGGALGAFDFAVLVALDANMTVGGRDATLLIGLLFFLPYAALGWAVGGLAAARTRALRDRETIEEQLRALERAQRALVQEEKLAGIGRLAAGVAHEVRNPLGVIRASASMAQESFDPDSDPHRALAFVCEETDRLDRLVGSLLAFARPQPVECVPTELAKVVDRALDLARGQAAAEAVDLETALAPDLPPVEVDPDRLAGALYGLVLNAIEAIAEARPALSPDRRRVRIAAERSDDVVRVTIRDGGPGVPDALRDSIFEPFVTSKDTGTGLGLPMALRLIEAQGGRLELAEDDPADPASRVRLPGAGFVLELALRSETERST